jgi:acylphosphatase
MKNATALTIFGRVQGVGFRFSAVQKAEQYGVKGFVKNQVNGTVYIEAEGEPKDLNKFIEWCKEGPMSARVENVEKQEIPLQNFRRFSVK